MLLLYFIHLLLVGHSGILVLFPHAVFFLILIILVLELVFMKGSFALFFYNNTHFILSLLGGQRQHFSNLFDLCWYLIIEILYLIGDCVDAIFHYIVLIMITAVGMGNYFKQKLRWHYLYFVISYYYNIISACIH